MRKIFVSVIALASLASLAGCNAYDPTDRALGGAAIGGGTGALIGGLATGRPGGALVGAALGAGAGAVVGAATTPRGYSYAYNGPAPLPGHPYPRCLQEGYDYNGRVYCMRWDYPYDRAYGYNGR
jgi:hypothetical protein